VTDGEVIGKKHHAGGISVREADGATVDKRHATTNTQNPRKGKPSESGS
jgi:hypothetical protein